MKNPAKRKPATHCLKTHLPVFQPVEAKLKTFEIRKNDRDFRVGDYLFLMPCEGDCIMCGPGYIPILAKVTYILDGGQYGIEPGYVAMAIKVLTLKQSLRYHKRPAPSIYPK